ncbi:MAG TPA: SDR family oxidoreductase [Candidatus Anaerobiospirillum stercoravium]|nr:SDR family oxidoreductase [Candidatus Anaerobiospirillum stercoravium]
MAEFEAMGAVVQEVGAEASKPWGGKVVLITGAATGIGAATARKFAREGYGLILGDYNVSALDDTVASLVGPDGAALPSGQVLALRCDVCDKESIKAMVAAGMAHFGHIDYLFANAGIHRNNTILSISDEELELVVRTNVFGVVYTIQAVLPHMLEQGAGSVLINCSDQWYIGKKNSFAYGLTKGALGQITRSLAVEYMAQNIRINAICPGTIDTPIAARALGNYAERAGLSLEEAYKEEGTLFIGNRLGTPEEVADMAFFILVHATFSTGSHFGIDGGISAS